VLVDPEDPGEPTAGAIPISSPASTTPTRMGSSSRRDAQPGKAWRSESGGGEENHGAACEGAEKWTPSPIFCSLKMLRWPSLSIGTGSSDCYLRGRRSTRAVEEVRLKRRGCPFDPLSFIVLPSRCPKMRGRGYDNAGHKKPLRTPPVHTLYLIEDADGLHWFHSSRLPKGLIIWAYLDQDTNRGCSRCR
jgi:hypothetical protein